MYFLWNLTFIYLLLRVSNFILKRSRLGPTGFETTLTPGKPGIVEPEVLHSVEPIGPVSFYVAFHR